MTAEEIRGELINNMEQHLLMMAMYGMLGELTAQIAELNEALREGNYAIEVRNVEP